MLFQPRHDRTIPPFKFERLPTEQILVATLRGMWTIQTVAEMEKELFAIPMISRLTLLPVPPEGRPCLLVDAREHGVQPQNVVPALQRLVAGTGHLFRKRAIVVDGVLHQLQSQRILSDDSHRAFRDMAEARDWLAS